MNHDTIILTSKAFRKYFDNAYAAIIDGEMFDIYNDYETEDGRLMTAFVNEDKSDIILIDPETENNCLVSYHRNYHTFWFTNNSVPAFQLLSIVTV